MRDLYSASELKPGMVFAYEQPISDFQVALGERPRVLVLRFLGASGAAGKRYMFDVVGRVDSDDSWSPGTTILDAPSVERLLANGTY